MIFDGTPEQAGALLGAMAAVGAASNDGALSDLDRAALISAGDVIFGLARHVVPDDLEAPSPSQLADALGDRGDEALVPLVVMSTVDARVVDTAADLVRDYTDALGIDSPAVADLEHLVHDELDAARADMLRRNRASITGDWVDDTSTYGEWLFPYDDAPDPDLTARYRSLGEHAEGTFGRAFHDFYTANGFGFAGEPGAAADAFTTPHDSAHVLSGYDTSVQGELLVSTYTAGMHRAEGLAGHMLPVIISWHLGVPLAKLAGSATGALDAPKFWVAWQRGDQTGGDTFDPEWNFWDVVDRPLDELRAEMAVPPLDPADAADGVFPDWYEPSA